jgi:hypothetical protein
MFCREEISRFRLEQSDHLKDVDVTTLSIINAITKQGDIFQAAHGAQITLMRTLQEDTVAVIEDFSHKIIQEIRVRLLSNKLFASTF